MSEQLDYRPTPTIQPPYRHCVDLPATRGLQQRLPSLKLGSTRTDFFRLQCDGPALPGGVFPHRPGLQWDGLLVMAGDAVKVSVWAQSIELLESHVISWRLQEQSLLKELYAYSLSSHREAGGRSRDPNNTSNSD
jgi:hypothetical protein